MPNRSLNKVLLIGNLTRDPELRYTPQGTAVCTFGLATNRSWNTEQGEHKESVEFHRIVAWNKLAEICSQLLFKGRRVYVEGRLQTRQWEGQDGNQRQTTEVVISDMIILDSKRSPGEGTEETVISEESPALSQAVSASPQKEKSEKEETKEEKEEGKKEEGEEEKTQKEKKEKEETVNAKDIPF